MDDDYRRSPQNVAKILFRLRIAWVATVALCVSQVVMAVLDRFQITHFGYGWNDLWAWLAGGILLTLAFAFTYWWTKFVYMR